MEPPWLYTAALEKAADHSGQKGSFQKSELMKREQARKARRDKIAEELFGKSMMRKQLESRDEQLEHELQVWPCWMISIAEQKTEQKTLLRPHPSFKGTLQAKFLMCLKQVFKQTWSAVKVLWLNTPSILDWF